MIAGKVKCDFCNFIGDMVAGKTANKSAMNMPEGWVSIHPMVVVHGMRGLKADDKRTSIRDTIKEKVKEKVVSLHACPACCRDRNVFGIELMLPAAPEREVSNPMKAAGAH